MCGMGGRITVAAWVLLSPAFSLCGCSGRQDRPPPPDVPIDTGLDIRDTGPEAEDPADVPSDVDDDDAGTVSYRLRVVDWQKIGSNVIVFVSVTTEDGVAVETLSQDDFWVLEDGMTLSVESGLDIEKRPSNFVWRSLVIFDTSYSVLSMHSLSEVVEPTRTLSGNLIVNDTQAEKVSVAAFDGAANLRPVVRKPHATIAGRWVTYYTAYRRKLDMDLDDFLVSECTTNTDCECSPSPCTTERPECVSGLCIDRSTDLYGAVIDGIDSVEAEIVAETRNGVPRGGSLVVFTDGSDRAARHTLSEVSTAVAGTNVYMFAVGVEGEIDSLILSTIGRDGTVLITSLDSLDAAMDQVWQYIDGIGNGIYLISYCTPARSGSHQISFGIVGTDAEAAVGFTATSDALCDPGAAATACEGIACGASVDDIYCGDCAGDEHCQAVDHVCVVACEPGWCGTSDVTAAMECGGCASGTTCTDGACI